MGMSPAQHMASVRCLAGYTVFISISHSWQIRSTCTTPRASPGPEWQPLACSDQDLHYHTIAAQTPPEINTAPPTRLLVHLVTENQPRHHAEPQMGLRETAAGHCEHLQPTCLLWGDRQGCSPAIWGFALESLGPLRAVSLGIRTGLCALRFPLRRWPMLPATCALRRTKQALQRNSLPSGSKVRWLRGGLCGSLLTSP